MQEIKNGIDRTHLIGTDVSGSIPLPKKYEKALAFVLHRNLVHFCNPQNKQFTPTLCVGLTCLRIGLPEPRCYELCPTLSILAYKMLDGTSSYDDPLWKRLYWMNY